MKNFEIACLHMWERKLAGQDSNGGAQPMDIGHIDKYEGEDEDVNAVQQRRSQDRSKQRHKQESDNERKFCNRRTANPSPSASRQSTPRDKKPESDETKQSAGKKKRLICYRCGGKGHPARLCPSGDDCQDVDVRKPLICANRLLERGHKHVLDEKPRIQCKNGDTIPLERTGSLFAVRLWILKGFHRQG